LAAYSSVSHRQDSPSARLDPGEARRYWRCGTLNEAAHPADRRTTEPGREDLRVSGHQPSVRGGVDEQPARRYPVREAIASGQDGQTLRLDLLAARGSDGAPRSSSRFQISTSTRHRAGSSRMTTSIARDGSAGRVGSSRSARRPNRRARPRTKLLGTQVARIARFVHLDVSREGNRQRPTKGEAECEPGIEWRRGPIAALEVADPPLAQPDPVPERPLCDSAAYAGAVEVTSERRRDARSLAGPVDLGSGAPDSGHIAHSVAGGASLGLNGVRGARLASHRPPYRGFRPRRSLRAIAGQVRVVSSTHVGVQPADQSVSAMRTTVVTGGRIPALSARLGAVPHGGPDEQAPDRLRPPR